MVRNRIIWLFALAILFAGCSRDAFDLILSKKEAVNYTPAQGVEYLFEGNEQLPEIHVDVTEGEWNRLLTLFDRNPRTKQNVRCDVTYVKNGGKALLVRDAGIRLRGNTSRRRPEGTSGRMHVTDNTRWFHVHFGLNFHKYYKDAAHELHGQRKLVLKYFHEDPTYAREIFCYDLFRRAGIWSASRADYCRLFLHVGEDKNEVDYGVYGMYEAVDMNFIKVRKKGFGGANGYLWKCRYGATLRETEDDFGIDDESDNRHVYEFKSDPEDFTSAKAMLVNFIYQLNHLEGEEFRQWITSVCDVDFLLRTYAVNVAVGMWDDYWCNKNNYYIYFNSKNPSSYKFYLIPYDYDNTLGTSRKLDWQTDSGRQNPYEWGLSSRPLIYKLLQFDEFKAIYRDELLRLIDPAEGLMDYDSSVPRILEWQKRIRPYISNITREDMTIYDRPASWGNHPEYRVYTWGPDNWFTVKAASLREWLR